MRRSARFILTSTCDAFTVFLSQALLVDLLGGLAYCVRQAATSPPDTTRDIVHRVPNLLEILWKRRELINLSVLNEYGLVPYNEPMPEQNIVELVVFFRYAHSKMYAVLSTTSHMYLTVSVGVARLRHRKHMRPS